MENSKRDIHLWFGLSYASFLVLPRTVLQSMPLDWQYKFVKMLDEAEESFGNYTKNKKYAVLLRDKRGKFKKDDLGNYGKGRRILKSQKNCKKL